MPREAALRARESLRATINEDHLQGIEEIVGRKRAPRKRYGEDADKDFAPRYSAILHYRFCTATYLPAFCQLMLVTFVGRRSKKMVTFPTKRMRCGECEGCLSTNCGQCRFCLDMPQFGGRNIMRQSCMQRKCKASSRRHTQGGSLTRRALWVTRATRAPRAWRMRSTYLTIM
jgi:hypothetical protein